MTIRTKRPARRALAYALGTPWSIQEDALRMIVGVAERHNANPEAVAAELGRELDNTHAVTVRNGVASIPVNGPMFRYANVFSEVSGATSYEDLATDLGAALNDPSVKAILLAVDSPGGEVNGASELSELIYRARGTKPIVAHIGGLGASAAYWVASACDRVVVSSSALAGNLGVLMNVTDYSESENFDGSRDIEFVSSQTPNKVMDPATKAGRDRIQAICDKLAAVFLGDVARNRGVSLATVLADFGKGDVMIGADAVRAGLADAMGTFEQTHAKLAATAAKGGGLVASAELEAPAPVFGPRRAAADAFLAELVPMAGPLRLGISSRATLADGLARVATQSVTGATHAAGVLAALEAFAEGASGSVVPASAPSPSAITQPAARAAAHTEGTMDEAAEKAAAAQQRELDRRQNLMDIAAEYDVPAARLKGWITGNVAPEAATRELASEYRARVREMAVPGAEGTDAAVATAANPRVRVGQDRAAAKPFASFGEQLHAVVQAGRPEGHVDPRLRNINRIAAGTPSGMNESVGSEGGFFIQPELLPGIIDPVYAEDPILSRVQRIPISGNAIKFNVVDEVSRANGSRWGAIQMYWVADADTVTAKKPKLRQVALDLKKLMGIGYLTDELVEDAPASEALLVRAFRAELAFMLTAAIFSGEGGGMPLGFQKSGALVSQAIEAGQTIANSNASISFNVAKMLSRVPASLWSQVIFLYQQELLSTFINATIGAGSAVPLFIPVGGLGGMPSDTVLGRAAYASEFCEAVGTPGDLFALVPSQYILGDKGGPNQATSLHVRFLYDEMALRITYRVDGQPLWYSAVTPYKGANSRSPFVNLAVRV